MPLLSQPWAKLLEMATDVQIAVPMSARKSEPSVSVSRFARVRFTRTLPLVKHLLTVYVTTASGEDKDPNVAYVKEDVRIISFPYFASSLGLLTRYLEYISKSYSLIALLTLVKTWLTQTHLATVRSNNRPADTTAVTNDAHAGPSTTMQVQQLSSASPANRPAKKVKTEHSDTEEEESGEESAESTESVVAKESDKDGGTTKDSDYKPKSNMEEDEE